MTESAFQDLVIQVKSGDERGLKTVFELSSRYCIRTLIKKTRCSQEDAEDLYMDAILIFRENILAGKLEKLSNLPSYVFGICWNLWREIARAQSRWNAVEDEIGRQLFHLNGQDPSIFLHEEEEERQRTVKQVTEALQALNDRCRELLLYFYVEKRPQQEIALLMGFTNANVVKVTRHRCYQQWIKHIEQPETRAHGRS